VQIRLFAGLIRTYPSRPTSK